MDTETRAKALELLLVEHSGWDAAQARDVARVILRRFQRADGKGKWRTQAWVPAQPDVPTFLYTVHRKDGLEDVWAAHDESEAKAVAAALNEFEPLENTLTTEWSSTGD